MWPIKYNLNVLLLDHNKHISNWNAHHSLAYYLAYSNIQHLLSITLFVISGFHSKWRQRQARPNRLTQGTVGFALVVLC